MYDGVAYKLVLAWGEEEAEKRSAQNQYVDGAVPMVEPVDYVNLTRAISGGAGIPPSSPDPRSPAARGRVRLEQVE